MIPTDTDLFLARIHARALDGDSFAAADVLRLLDLVERLSRELLAARSVGTPLGAAPGESSAEGSIPSSPRPLASPPSSPTPPAPEAAHGLSSVAAGSEGGSGLRPCPDCGDGRADQLALTCEQPADDCVCPGCSELRRRAEESL